MAAQPDAAKAGTLPVGGHTTKGIVEGAMLDEVRRVLRSPVARRTGRPTPEQLARLSGMLFETARLRAREALRSGMSAEQAEREALGSVQEVAARLVAFSPDLFASLAELVRFDLKEWGLRRRVKGVRAAVAPAVCPLPSGAHPERWEDIEMYFFTKGVVQIKASGATWNVGPEEMGFARKHATHPIVAWEALFELAKNGGQRRVERLTDQLRNQARQASRTSKPPTGPDPTRDSLAVAEKQSASARKARQRVQKRMQEIRDHLQQYFKLSDNPIPFVGGFGYRARLCLRAK